MLEVKVKAVSHARVHTCIVRETRKNIFLQFSFLVSFRQFGVEEKRIKFENGEKSFSG